MANINDLMRVQPDPGNTGNVSYGIVDLINAVAQFGGGGAAAGNATAGNQVTYGTLAHNDVLAIETILNSMNANLNTIVTSNALIVSATGATTNTAWDAVSGSASQISILKRIALDTNASEALIAHIDTLSGTIASNTTTILSRTPALGQAAMASSIPVVIASDQSVIPVSVSSFPLPTGASTSALQTTQQTTLSSVLSTLGDPTDAAWDTVSASATQTSILKRISNELDSISSDINTSNSYLVTIINQINSSNTLLGSIDSRLNNIKSDTASTVTILGNIQARTPGLGQAVMAASSPVVIASNQSAIPISAAALPLPTGAATEATLAAVSGKLPATLGQKTMAASMAVVLASDQSAIPVTMAAVPTGASLEATQLLVKAKTDNIDVALSTRLNTLGQKTLANSAPVSLASDTFAASNFSNTIVSAIGTNTTSLRTFPTRFLGMNAGNTTATPKYIKVFDYNTVPVLGTNVPVMNIMIPAMGAVTIERKWLINMGTGFSIAITGGSALLDSTPVAAGDVVLNISYQGY